jgi:phosphoglycolate phosphatase
VTQIRAVLFDKDGTLFDFRRTWGPWTGDFIERLAGSPEAAARLAEAVGYDLEARQHLPHSAFIAGTAETWGQVLVDNLPGWDLEALIAHIGAETAHVPQVPAAPLVPLFAELRARGLALGVATNDGIGPVTRHLTEAGLAELVDFVAGYDSGHGAKPGPGMLLAFARAAGVAPAEALMVGDSTHDLFAARAAGMPAVAVLTGHAEAADLAPHAEAVLDTIAELPGWLDARADKRRRA